MSSFLYELGRTAFRRRKTFIAVWIAIFVLIAAFVGIFSKSFSDNFSLPGSESQEALDSMDVTFPEASGATASIIVVAPDGKRVTDEPYRKVIDDATDKVDDLGHVEQATSPFDKNIKGNVSKGDRAARINIQYDDEYQNLPDSVKSQLDHEADAMKDKLPKDTQVAPGGDIYKVTGVQISWVEGLGVAIAFVVLLFTFGSVLAAGLPLITAVFGVLIGLMLIVATTAFADVSSTAPMLALMLGLAVGIDYALFIVSRTRSLLKDGLEPEEAAARALATAGSAVVFAGMTVVIALVGLVVCRMPFLTVMGFGAAGTVAVAVCVALTLVPALMGVLNKRLIPRSVRKARAAQNGAAEARVGESHAGSGAIGERGTANHNAAAALSDSRGGRRSAHAPQMHQAPSSSVHDDPDRKRGFAATIYHFWVTAATKIPLLTIVVILVGLGLFAIPASKITLALPDNGGEEKGTPARTTFDLTEKYFGPGYNGPLLMTAGIIGSDDPVGDVKDMKKQIERVPGVEKIVLATPNKNADTALFQIIPTTGPSDPKTDEVVKHLRDLEPHFQDEFGFPTAVTGSTAVGIDVSDQLGKSLLPFGIFVVGLSLILLMMVFRSIAVPIKATFGFLLSVIAAMGVVSFVFVEGHGASLLNLEQVGPVISFLPIMLMGILFGLAMDYEVFLVSGMREAYVHGASAKEAVTKGFMSSASVVVAAAVIMFSVFFAFVPTGEPIIKSIALGLAVGIFVDAFIVRMTFVPAVMALLGNAAWWLPKWLNRILPHFDVEGEGLYHQVALRDWPEPDSPYRVYGKGLSLGTKNNRIFDDVDVALLPGQVLAISGRGADALLLALSGRANPDSGDLKVGQYVLPEQANKVRKRTPYLALNPNDPALRPSDDYLRRLISQPPELLVIDEADRPHDHATAELETQLIRAAIDNGSAVILVLGNHDADWMIPPHTDYTLLDLDAAHDRTPVGAPAPATMGGHH